MQQLVDLFGFFSVVLHAGTLVFESLVLGGIFFLLWTARSRPDLPQESMERVHATSWTLLRISAIGLAVVQVLYLFVDSSVLMSTAEIPFSGVVGASFFVAGSIILGAATLTAIIAGKNQRFAKYALPVLAVVILAASLMTDHAVARMENRPYLVIITTIHVAATGLWIGGLPFLMLGLFRARDRATRWYITERFSRSALVSVGALALSGLALSFSYIGSVHEILGTAYGVMVSAKALMLGALLILGGVNFFLLRGGDKEDVMPRLRRLVEAEVGIGLTVILTAASLTSQPPAIDQPNDTVTPHQIAQRLKPVWPRLGYPDAVLAENAAAAQSTARGTTQDTAQASTDQPVPPAYDIDGVVLSWQRIASASESESNHHWMGIVVLAMGLLALLARTGKAPWAEYWPLLLICIAMFIFIRADTESWPVGPQGFWACWLKPEVFQHRVAALVCIGFAFFELRVRRQGHANSSIALVFPLMCALGGALLLTHSHPVINVKENLLVELNHVPLGLAAVFAGWARWLELRLPAKDRSIPAWIWPVCFVLIGVGLLNYREA
jgi:putative copper resistance protein D